MAGPVIPALRRYGLAAAALLGAVLAGCAARPAAEQAPAEVVYGVADCFRASAARDFRALDRRRLLVYAPASPWTYLVVITPPAPELRSANTVAFASRSGRVCGYAGDSLYFRNLAATRYAVVSVRRLDEAAEAELLGAAGAGPGSPPAPEAVAEPELEPIEPAPAGGNDRDEPDQNQAQEESSAP